MSLQATAWQTVGPYFQIGLEPLYGRALADPGTAGTSISIEVLLLDGNGVPVPDAIVEIWQADAAGKYTEDGEGGFHGFGRAPTDEQGRLSFTTIKPGRVPGPGGMWQAPHLAVRLMMRGLLKDLITRMYFPETEASMDPIFASIPPHRRQTLLLELLAEGHYRWTIHLQGSQETVFFEC